MVYEIQQLDNEHIPFLLSHISDTPTTLFAQGNTDILTKRNIKFLTIVGSRKYTPYGKAVCEKLISELSGSPIVIVSGLALGIDAIAHRAALKYGIPTVAVPGSGLSSEVLYPRTNIRLAEDILQSNGLLLSEFEPQFRATKWSFAKRNRIMAGMSHATLLIEAEERSGTLITARLALDYDRELLVVPHDITRPSSHGVHQFLKLGATPITSGNDILEVLNITTITQREKGCASQLPKDEQNILALLQASPCTRTELIEKLNLSVTEVNILLSHMELKGILIEKAGILSSTV